jgi:hypothetical protein
MVKIISPNIVRVEPKYYSTLRSFLESSLKDEYQWNTGVLLPGTHNALFIKRGKWILNINHRSAILFTKDFEQVLLTDTSGVVLTIGKGSYKGITDPEKTFVIAEPPASLFDLPLPLSQIIERTKVYREAHKQAVPEDYLRCRRECYTDC